MSDSSKNFSIPGNETIELIKHVRKKIWWYLSIVIVIGGASFFILRNCVFEYTATSSFFINDLNGPNTGSMESLPSGDNLNRIYQMVNSTQTQLHLIDKFNLYEHYNIDSTDKFHVQVAIEKLRSKIDVKKNPYNAIIVTVKDRSSFQSADMANEIVSFIEKLNQEFYIKNIQNSVRLSEAYIKELESESILKSVGIDSLIEKINQTINNGHNNNANLYYLLMQQQKLTEIVDHFEASAKDIQNAHKIYTLTLQTMDFNNFPTVSIIQTAMPDLSTHNQKALILSILIMILVFLILILQAYFIKHYNGYLVLLYTGK